MAVDDEVQGHDLSCEPESLRSEPSSLDRKPALDDAPGSAEALTDVDQNTGESLLTDSTLVISQTVSVDADKGERDLHPTQPAPAVECIEDAVKMNEDIPCRSCIGDAAEVDNMDISDCDRVISEAASDLLEASAVIVETQKELDNPFAMSLMVDNDGSSLAKLEGSNSETRDGGDHGQINEKEIENDNPSERDCPASSPLTNNEVSDVRERLCTDLITEIEDLDDREKSCRVGEFILAHSHESKQPLSSVVGGDRLSDFPLEQHDAQMNDGQGLCLADEIVPEESYRTNEPSSTPEIDLSTVMKLDDQAEEMKVCSDPPQSSEVVTEKSSAGNQLASFSLTNGESSDAKAEVVDIESGNLKETSRDSDVMPENLLQESIGPASYAISEKEVVESHEDNVTIAAAEEKADVHKTAIEVEENSLAVERSDLEIAEANDTIIDDQGDASLADPVVPEAETESLNHSLSPDKVSPEVLGRGTPSSTPEEKQVDSDEKVQTMQAVDEGRDASVFYTPPSSPMIVDKPEISGEEVEVNEATGDVKHSSEDCEVAFHKDIKGDPSEVMVFMPEDQLKGDPMSTKTENELAFVSAKPGEGSEPKTSPGHSLRCEDQLKGDPMSTESENELAFESVKPGEGSEPEISQGHSLQCAGSVVENVVDADFHLAKPEGTEEILHLPSEVLKELQSKDDAVNEGTERHENLEQAEKRSDATCIDDVVANSPLAGNESSELFPSDVIREGQIEDNKVKGQTGADEAVTSDGREPETTRIDDVVLDSASAGNESSEILPSVVMKDGRSEDSSANQQTEGDETVMQEEREPEASCFDDVAMDGAFGENESPEVLPLVAVNEGRSEDDMVNERTEGHETIIREEREPGATCIDDVVMNGASAESEPSEMLPFELIKEGRSEDDTVKEQTEGGGTLMEEEGELNASHIDDVVMKGDSAGNESSEILPSEAIKEGQSDADAVNEQAKEHKTITSGGSESDASLIHDVAPYNASAGNKSSELLPSDVIMECQTEIDSVNEQTEVPETAMSEGLESDAFHIDDVPVSAALARNESMEILPCDVIKAGQSECDPVKVQSEGPELVMSECLELDTSHIDQVVLDNASAENEAREVLPSSITEKVTDGGKIEDEPVVEQTGPEPLMSEGRKYDTSRLDDAAINSASVENETPEVLPLDVNVANEGKSEDHLVDELTGGHVSLVSEGYESDATGDDDVAIDIAVVGDESSDIPTVVPEDDVASKEQPSPTNDLQELDVPSSTNSLEQGAADGEEPSSANDPKGNVADEDYTSLKNDTVEKNVVVDDGIGEAASQLDNVSNVDHSPAVASEDLFGEKMESDKIDDGEGKASYSPAGQTSEGN